MNRIAIIGLGQIGSSLGIDFRAKLRNVEVVGHDKEPTVSGRARKIGAIDQIAYTLPGAVERAALVVLATPVAAMREVMTVIAPHLEEGAIVIDTGSTKAEVLKWAEEILPKSVDFVGGHPMAGSETPGVAGAQPGLFNNAVYCILPAPSAREEAVKAVVEIVRSIGARPYFLDAVEHDSFVASVSHLPIALSIALMETAAGSPSWREVSRLAAGSFRDVSRLASGSPEMHRDIFLTNRDTVLYWLDQFAKTLQSLRDQIAEGDVEGLTRTLEHANEERTKWLERRVGDIDAGISEVPSMMESATALFFGDRVTQIAKKAMSKDKKDRQP